MKKKNFSTINIAFRIMDVNMKDTFIHIDNQSDRTLTDVYKRTDFMFISFQISFFVLFLYSRKQLCLAVEKVN